MLFAIFGLLLYIAYVLNRIRIILQNLRCEVPIPKKNTKRALAAKKMWERRKEGLGGVNGTTSDGPV